MSEVADLDFNYNVFDGDSADAASVVASANTVPFASERRLVIVRRADSMSTADLNVLADYALDPAEHTCLVLVASRIAKNTRVYKAVAKLGGVAEYAAPRKSEYPSKVVGLFKERGKTVGLEAAELLVRAVGRDLRRLETEIEKVCAFAGGSSVLSKEDVEAVVATTATTSVFDFLSALGMRECRDALRLLARILGSGQSVAGVHAMTVRHVRQLLGTRALSDRGQSQTDVAAALGLAPWQARDLVRQAGRHSAKELVGALVRAASCEAEMKTSRDSRLAFERWIIEFCRQAPGR